MQNYFMLAVVFYKQGMEAATFGPVSGKGQFSEHLKLWSPSFQIIPRANKFHPNHLLPV